MFVEPRAAAPVGRDRLAEGPRAHRLVSGHLEGDAR